VAFSADPIPKEEAVAQDKADSMMWRAHEKVPRAPYKGTSFGHMSSVLNKWITRKANATKPCDQFEVAELQKLQAVLYFLRLPAYDDVYQASSDTRALRAPLEELQNDWEQLNKAAAQDEELELMHRDGHCHEAVMWWTHHLTEVRTPHVPPRTPDGHRARCPHRARAVLHRSKSFEARGALLGGLVGRTRRSCSMPKASCCRSFRPLGTRRARPPPTALTIRPCATRMTRV
jgi:hypothetical protein